MALRVEKVINMSNKNNNFKFKFLEDRPAQTDKELEELGFGHREIGETLINIVEKSPAPFTIGLFGKWGSGKSSIAYFLKKKLPQKKIPVVIFDVWKHQKDALYRTFLKEIVEQLKGQFIDKDFRLEDRLESSVSKTQEGKFKINWKKVKQLKWWGIGVVIFIGLLWFLAYLFGYLGQFYSFIGILVSIISGGSIVVLLIQIATQFLTTETTTFSIDRFRDPYEFEKEFVRIIKNLVPRRILIIFDNLDRVTRDRAIEVLATIKTFLEPKDIEITEKETVFLIPCDVEAIKTYICSLYKIKGQKRPFDPDEFIKKFFNSIIWIPDFIPSELESYTADRLKETDVGDLDKDVVAWIIAKAFRENPRQIKQFINLLLAHYLLIKERSGKGKDFQEDFLLNNTPQLTEYLILNQLFSEEMQELRNEKIWNLEEVNKEILQTGEAAKFLKFIDETKQIISLKNLRIFFTLRRSEEEKEFPGIEEFISFLKDRKEEEAKKFLNNIKDFKNRKESFGRIIKGALESERNPVAATNIINTLFVSLNSIGQSLDKTVYGEVCTRLTSSSKEYLHTTSPSELTSQLLSPFPEYRSSIIKHWVVILEDQKNSPPKYQVDNKFLEQLFKIMVENSDWFYGYQERIKKVLAEKFTQEMYIAELFSKKEEAQKAFISPDYISNFISGISPPDIESQNLSKKIEILSQFKDELFTTPVNKNMLNKLIELQNYEKTKPFDEKRKEFKEKLNSDMENILKRLDTSLKEVSDQNIWIQIVDVVLQGMNVVPDWESRRSYIQLLLVLEKFTKEPKLLEIKTNVTNFFNSVSQLNIDYVISKIDKPDEFIEKSHYASAFENRAIGDQNIFDYFYPKINQELKNGWLIKLLTRDYNRALNKIEKEDYKGIDQIKITQKILEMVEGIDTKEKLKFYSACNRMECGNDLKLRNLYINKLKTHLTTPDQMIQNIGFQAFSSANFLTKDERRRVIKDIFDWLGSLSPQDKYQPFSIRTIANEINSSRKFTKEEKGDFLQLIFDEIRRTNQLESVNSGFEILSLDKLKPKYEERKENFSDLKSRIESETNLEIKKALVAGLKKIKPSVSNDQNKEFWKWVDKKIEEQNI